MENLNFHDCKVYAFAFEPSKYLFLLDIDFITEWIKNDDELKYSFYVAPATLIFENVWNLSINIDTNLDVIINDINKANPSKPKNNKYIDSKSVEYDWVVDLIQGDISLKSIGYKLNCRSLPILKTMPFLENKERGNVPPFTFL